MDEPEDAEEDGPNQLQAVHHNVDQEHHQLLDDGYEGREDLPDDLPETTSPSKGTVKWPTFLLLCIRDETFWPMTFLATALKTMNTQG